MARRVFAYSGLALLLALPRIARMLHPQVWIEDDSYVHGAFLLSRGYLPYHDFPLPHFPLLETMMAAVFLIAPITIRTAEAFTQIAAFVASLLVFAIGRRLADVVTGTCAALVVATSSLLFRYHVFEREVFLVVPVLAAFLLMTQRDDDRAGWRPVTAGVLLACAIAVKLTAATALVGIVAWLLVDRRHRAAAVVTMTAAAIVTIAAVVLATRFGTDFLVQVVVFRLVHATVPSLGVKLDELRYSMDVTFALGISGLLLIIWRGEVRRWRGPLVQIACGFVGLVLFNPTYWAHTGIELLPWLSLCGGRLLAALPDLFAAPRRRSAALCLATAIALMLFVAPIRNVNWQPGDNTAYGFGYRDRAELEQMGAFIRAHSGTDALVATPPLIAFVANRPEAVPYVEIAGTVDELTASVRQNGYWKTIASRAGAPLSFWDSVEASRDRMTPTVDAALAAHRIAVVINDSPDDLFPVPLINLAPDDLKRSGYGLQSVSAHYEAWTPR